jgi:hypothetical protein
MEQANPEGGRDSGVKDLEKDSPALLELRGQGLRPWVGWRHAMSLP